jgi:hypothetical protein
MVVDPSCRVAIVYRLDHPGGVQSCAFSVIRGLNKIGLVPDVLWDIEPDWTLLRKENIQANYVPFKFRIPTRRIERMPVSMRYLAWAMNEIHGEALPKQHDFYYIFFNGFIPPHNTAHLRYLSGPPLVPQLVNTRSGLIGLPGRFSLWFYRHILGKFSRAYRYHPTGTYVINSKFTAESV